MISSSFAQQIRFFQLAANSSIADTMKITTNGHEKYIFHGVSNFC